jgi:hypothetical protein
MAWPLDGQPLGGKCLAEPKSQDAKSRVYSGVHAPFYITNVGVNSGLNTGCHGVLRCGPRIDRYSQTDYFSGSSAICKLCSF